MNFKYCFIYNSISIICSKTNPNVTITYNIYVTAPEHTLLLIFTRELECMNENTRCWGVCVIQITCALWSIYFIYKSQLQMLLCLPVVLHAARCCNFPGRRIVLVLDGSNPKNLREDCFIKDAGFVEFEGLPGLIKTSWLASPAFKSRYCVRAGGSKKYWSRRVINYSLTYPRTQLFIYTPTSSLRPERTTQWSHWRGSCWSGFVPAGAVEQGEQLLPRGWSRGSHARPKK